LWRAEEQAGLTGGGNDRGRIDIGAIERHPEHGRRHVETDIADDSFIAITKGVKDGEQIVIGPGRVLRFLNDGERVRPMAADQAAAEAAKPGEKKAGNGVWNP